MAKQTVLYISENRIWVKQIIDKVSEQDYGWDEATIVETFSKIKKDFGQDNFFIVLGNNISYSFVLRAREEKITRENVLSAAKLVSPVELNNENFDWQIIGEDQKKEGEDKWVQICGIRRKELQAISLAVSENKIKIEKMLPVGIMLARQTKQIVRPNLILWTGIENLGVISKKGLTYTSKTFSDNFDQEVEALVKYADEKINLDVKDLVIDINKWQGVEQIFANWEVNHCQLDPMIEIAMEKEEKGSDEEILELRPDLNMTKEKIEVLGNEEEKKEIKQEKDEVEKNNGGLKIWQVIIGIALAIGMGVGFYLLTNLDGGKQELAPVIEEEIAVTPTVMPVNLSQYRLQILNGSGIEGEAGRIRERLEALGFKDFVTGNADSYDYEITEINYKQEISDEVIIKIIEELDIDRETTKSAELEDDNEFDIRLILGEMKD